MDLDFHENLSNLPIMPDEVYRVLEKDFFYFLPNYPTKKVLRQTIWDQNLVPSNFEPHHYYNIDYRMLKYYNVLDMITTYGDLLYYLVTSIDQKGIQSPLCSENLDTYHPGGKRATIAGYLGIKTVPVLAQFKEKVKKYEKFRIKSVDQLLKLYNYQCSIKYRKDTGAIEVIWHGETKMRDELGYDNWFGKSTDIRNNNLQEIDFIPNFLLKNGLDIENPFISKTVTNGIFQTNYTHKSSSPIKIIVKDEKLINNDFWELFFHIDPSVFKKFDSTRKILIVNESAGSNNIILENCNLIKTLNRKKFFNPKIMQKLYYIPK
jgi:hypothetical protein